MRLYIKQYLCCSRENAFCVHVGSGVYGSLTVCVSHKKISISRSNNVCQCSQCVYVCACVCLRGVRACVCVSLHVGIHYRAPEFFPL